MTPSLYRLENIIQRFDRREVLNIPSLSLEARRIYVLQGPNGAGKTTLMRILSFMDAPAEGDIFFAGENVRPEQAARCRARVVWVPQSPVMFTGSLLYNVEYPMRIKGVPARERKEKAMALLRSVNLASLAKAPARKLSGGESQRGSIARALAAGPEVILFDEPTASVDYRSREEIIVLIRSLCLERGLSIVVTTHDAALAEEVGQESITLFDGKLAHNPAGAYGSAKLALPQTGGALPHGTLEKRGERFFFFAHGGKDAPQMPKNECMVVSGMAESEMGFYLRLSDASAAESGRVDLFLPFAANADLAAELRLGMRIELRPPETPCV